jgi:hypothetical protein
MSSVLKVHSIKPWSGDEKHRYADITIFTSIPVADKSMPMSSRTRPVDKLAKISAKCSVQVRIQGGSVDFIFANGFYRARPMETVF